MPTKTEYTLEASVRFAEVDSDQVMALPALFQLLQEAAIGHADLYGVGAHGIEERGTSWVLNRLAVGIERYPRRGEALRVETWSTGVSGFRGYREFRLFCGEELLLSASSLWVWIDLRTRTLARVPEALAAAFPVGGAGQPPYRAELERRRYAAPSAASPAVSVTVRYSDFDANRHVNNTAFFDYLQTALVRQGRSPHPGRLELQFMREIPAGAVAVEVSLESGDAGTAVAISGPEGAYALGVVE
jgi:acyl-ACP thioesterase